MRRKLKNGGGNYSEKEKKKLKRKTDTITNIRKNDSTRGTGERAGGKEGFYVQHRKERSVPKGEEKKRTNQKKGGRRRKWAALEKRQEKKETLTDKKGGELCDQREKSCEG